MAVAPTQTGFVSALGLYGYRAGRTSGRRQWHGGWDFRGSVGDPVLAAEAGMIETIVRNDGHVLSILTPPPAGRAFNGYGNVVVVRQADGTWASYNHLNEVLVGPGQNVSAGQVLGTIGNTTNGKFRGMGAHLHFELRHAKPDSSSPFPGPYGRFGIDPGEWFAGLGLHRTRGVLASLGQEEELPPEGIEYEPPFKFWTPYSGVLLGAAFTAGAILID